MRKLIFQNIKIISLIEKKAIDLNLDQGFNIIIGENDTGKSSLMKSIYYTFGTNTNMDDPWIRINPIPIIDFIYDDKKYTIFRHGSKIVTFDEKLRILNYSTSITREFSIFFSKFFNFKIKLTSHKLGNIQATPAFCLLPFYIDQDKSWGSSWNSFKDLTQFTNWKNQIAEFHAGIRTSEYFDLKTKKDKLKKKREELHSNKIIVESIYNNRMEKYQEIDISIPMMEFKKEIEEFIIELNNEKRRIDILKEKLKQQYNKKYIIEDQIRITKNSYNEIGKDYKFCDAELEQEVECPICGMLYHNSFNERFSIAKDQETCVELIRELEDEEKIINNRIIKIKNEIDEKNSKTDRIENILKTKKEELTLRDLIEFEGEKNLLVILKDEKDELNINIAKLDAEIKEMEKRLKKFTSKERKDRLLRQYRVYMSKYTQKLNVLNLKEKNYEKMRANINLQGSDKPRALLAYFYAILKMIYEHSGDSAFFPILIDAPKQQDQDVKNEIAILNFIKDETPKDVQLLLSLTDLRNIKFDANFIELNKKLSILNKKDYEKCVSKYKKLNHLSNEYMQKKFNQKTL